MESIYELILDVLDQVKFEAPKNIQQQKFIRMSTLLFLKECENFWAWVEEASIEELDLFIASDGHFSAFLDIMRTREKNKKLIDSGELKRRPYSPSCSYKFIATANLEHQLRQQLILDVLEEDKELSRIIDEIAVNQ